MPATGTTSHSRWQHPKYLPAASFHQPHDGGITDELGNISMPRDAKRNMYSPTSSLLDQDTVKPVLSGHTERRQKMVFKTDYRIMQVKRIAECSDGSILQYFRPSLSYHLSFRHPFCLFRVALPYH